MPTTTDPRRTRTASRLVTLGALGITAALVLGGCGSDTGSDAESGASSSSDASSGSSSDGDAAPVSDGAAQVAITLENSGGKETCSLDHASAAAGPVTFTVTNASATAINEVELQSDQRILGEKENLAPGLDPVSFTLTLGGGDYEIYCPGADPETQPFSVTGEASAEPTGSAAQVLAKGAEEYGVWVATVLDDMVTAVEDLQQAVDSGDVEAAKTAYAAARPFYEKVESDVEGFVLPGTDPTDNSGNLDYRIDMRASNLDPAVGWSGFHAIERDLWQRGAITASTKKDAASLTADVTKLADLAKDLTYKPEDLANGAAGLLEEVQSGKIKGEEEAYSHLDLVDFNANLEGAQQAFAYLKPGMEEIDPELTQQISQRFDAVAKALQAYRDSSATGGFVAWTPQLRAKDANELSQTVQSLQDPLSRIAEKVATA